MSYWKDKVVLVIGGSAGLGFELAKVCLAQHAKVGIVARDHDRLNEAKNKLGNNVAAFVADITNQTDVDRLQSEVLEEFGKVDAVMNCAGKSTRGSVLDTSPEEFQQLFELNFLGLVRTTRAFMPALNESRGHLVNIGSLAAKAVSRYLGAYPVSKFPVAAYSQQLRLEQSKVHVLLVCPGPIARTDAGQRYENTDVPAEAQQPGGGVKLKGLDPKVLCEAILVACERRQLELVMPFKAKFLFAIGQLYPRLGDWLISKMTKT